MAVCVDSEAENTMLWKSIRGKGKRVRKTKRYHIGGRSGDVTASSGSAFPMLSSIDFLWFASNMGERVRTDAGKHVVVT